MSKTPKFKRRKKVNRASPVICACGSTAFIRTTATDIALVDADDASTLGAFGWFVVLGYPRAWNGERQISLHREIVGATPGVIVDHRNRKRWDSRRANLRSVTWTESARNVGATTRRSGAPCQSRFKGVRRRGLNTWQARIAVGSTRICLGSYALEEDAARAYDRGAIDLYGEFAVLNFPV